ncbi:hypothetical protein [Halobellus sp. EA9]|uniref:hypothetical protein n=1 Tax=Halobellus sp. EA9 TaxID=3421647 RepID=UPI003EBD9D51
MAGDPSGGSGLAGTAVRLVVVACFAGGAAAALTGRLVVAGGAFLAGHTLLGGAAVIQSQRRRGVGFSLSGLGWLLLSLGSAVGQSGGATAAGLSEQPLLLVGAGLVGIGTLLLVDPFGE